MEIKLQISPRIIEQDLSYMKTFFVMDKIEGQTISTKIFRGEHQGLKLENHDYLDTLTDRVIIFL